MSRAYGIATGLALAALAGGCEQGIGARVSGLQSLRVTMLAPEAAQRGTDDNPTTVTEAVVDVVAVDANGDVYVEDLDVDVYLSFAGNKIGRLTPCGDNEDSTPLATIHLTAGRASAQTVKLLRAYGHATLWFEEHPAAGGIARAFGAAPELVFPNPHIPEIQTPLDLNAPTAMYCSPWNGKQVTVVEATGNGKLVVTAAFPQAYVVADTGAMYDPMTGTGGFNHIYVFTFGKPPFFIQPGRVLGRVGGNVSKFVGFTELNFPYQQPASQTDLVQVPDPYELTVKDRNQHIRLLRLGASTVRATARVCPIDESVDSWKKYNQFVLNFGDGVCDPFSAFAVEMPSKMFFDALGKQGKMVTVTGVLKNSSGQNPASTPPTACKTDDDCAAAGLGTATCVEAICRRGPFNFWTILPGDPSDIKEN